MAAKRVHVVLLLFMGQGNEPDTDCKYDNCPQKSYHPCTEASSITT